MSEDLFGQVQSYIDKKGLTDVQVYKGANIDAVETAEKYGIDEDTAQDFHNDSEGIWLNYQVLDETIANFRSLGQIKSDWKEKIEKDFENRK